MGIDANEPVHVRWKCPKCGKNHHWKWSVLDCESGELDMQCQRKKCKALSRFYMAIDFAGRFVPVREINT